MYVKKTTRAILNYIAYRGGHCPFKDIIKLPYYKRPYLIDISPYIIKNNGDVYLTDKGAEQCTKGLRNHPEWHSRVVTYHDS